MRFLRRLFLLAFVLVTLYLLLLAVVGELAGRWAGERVQDRLARGLGAEVKLGGVDVGLVRGQLEVAQLDLKRSDVGAMHIVVQKAELDVAPLGGFLFSRDRAEELRVRGLSIELSTWAVLAPPPGNPLAFHVDRFDFSNVTLLVAPTLLLPGAGSVTLQIDRARGGATTLRSAVSWLFSVDELAARVTLPGGVVANVKYTGAARAGGRGPRSGTVVVSSSLFDKELTIPLTLPEVSAGDELAALRQLGTRISKEVGKRKASELLQKLWQ